jgi:hypothetical protein
LFMGNELTNETEEWLIFLTITLNEIN